MGDGDNPSRGDGEVKPATQPAGVAANDRTAEQEQLRPGTGDDLGTDAGHIARGNQQQRQFLGSHYCSLYTSAKSLLQDEPLKSTSSNSRYSCQAQPSAGSTPRLAKGAGPRATGEVRDDSDKALDVAQGRPTSDGAGPGGSGRLRSLLDGHLHPDSCPGLGQQPD